MKRKFSLAHLTVLDCAPPEMIYIANMAGYDYVSLRIITMGLSGENNYNLAKDKKLLKQTKRALHKTAIKIHDIELAKIDEETDIQEYEPAFKVAQELGVKNVISSIWTSNRNLYLEKFSELCDLADKYDLTVNLEFVTWAEIKDLEEAKEVLEIVDKENTAILIDTLHFHRSKVKPAELDEIPDKWLKFVHLCDGPAEIPDWDDTEALLKTGRDNRLYPGEGEIDLAAIIDKLPDNIVFSIELPKIEKVKEIGYAEHARRALEYSKNFLKRKV